MSICECCDPEAAAAAEAIFRADTTPPMGLEPATPGCRCHLCVPAPDDALDAADRRTVGRVWRHGWQVVTVSGGRGPDFAYTVGLPHRAGHPELLMSGLDLGLMHHCLNHLARRVLDGARFVPGRTAEGVLTGVPVLLERMRPSALATKTTCSRWFHRRRGDALQVIWPDTSARFAWQPGAAADLRTRQPASWRVPSGHTGMLASDPVWPLPTPPEAIAVACHHVIDGGAIPVQVERYDDNGADAWVIGCSADHGADLTQFTTSHLSHLVRATPSLAQIADLPYDAVIVRAGPDDAWTAVPG